MPQIAAIYVVLILIYTFFGGVLEHFLYFISSDEKSLKNPFMTGFPIYAIGALSMIGVCSALGLSNPVAIFFTTASVGTALEYLAGRYIAKAGEFSGDNDNLSSPVKSWDYRNTPLNFQGVISAKHFVIWGILGVVAVKTFPTLKKKVTAAILA